MAKPYELKKDQTLTIGACRSCGKLHEQLKLYRLTKPAGVHTHWYICQETAEPVMLALYETDDGYTEISELLADKIVEGMEAKQFLVTIHTLQHAGTKKQRIDHYFCPVNMPRSEFKIIREETEKWMTNDRRENEGLQPGEEPRTPEPAGTLEPAVNIFGDGPPVPSAEVNAYQGKTEPEESPVVEFLLDQLTGRALTWLKEADATAEARTVFANFYAEGTVMLEATPVLSTTEDFTFAAYNSATTARQLALALLPKSRLDVAKFLSSNADKWAHKLAKTPEIGDQTPIQKLMATPGVTVGEPEITRLDKLIPGEMAQPMGTLTLGAALSIEAESRESRQDTPFSLPRPRKPGTAALLEQRRIEAGHPVSRFGVQLNPRDGKAIHPEYLKHPPCSSAAKLFQEEMKTEIDAGTIVLNAIGTAPSGEVEVINCSISPDVLVSVREAVDQSVETAFDTQTGDDVTILFPPKPPAREQVATAEENR